MFIRTGAKRYAKDFFAIMVSQEDRRKELTATNTDCQDEVC